MRGPPGKAACEKIPLTIAHLVFVRQHFLTGNQFMKVEYTPDFPTTEAACKKATGKGLKEWFAELDAKPELNLKRRDAVSWIYETIGVKSSDVWWPTTIWVEYERAH
jgi:hypothetical protein